MTGRWGLAPMASTGDLRAKAAAARSSERATGVNQRGSIHGIVMGVGEKEVTVMVEARDVDEGALRESLGESLEQSLGEG